VPVPATVSLWIEARPRDDSMSLFLRTGWQKLADNDELFTKIEAIEVGIDDNFCTT
jgi:hypothetical protein